MRNNFSENNRVLFSTKKFENKIEKKNDPKDTTAEF